MKKLIYLEWVDSAGADGWQPIRDYTPSPMRIRSVGWLMDETVDHITLVGHLAREDDTGAPTEAHGWMTIPKCAVTVRREISLKRGLFG